jgi:hypothetical protein
MRGVRNGLPIKAIIKCLPDDIVSEEISRPKNEREGRKREERYGREKSHGGYVPEQREAMVCGSSLRFNFYAWEISSSYKQIKEQGIAQGQGN